jgi:hypothetical protein
VSLTTDPDDPRLGHGVDPEPIDQHDTYLVLSEEELTTAGLQLAVFARLSEPERRVLREIVEVYPDSIRKQDAGAGAGYSVGDKVGGTFGNILGRLRSLGLIDYPSPGAVVACDVLFLTGDRR